MSPGISCSFCSVFAFRQLAALGAGGGLGTGLGVMGTLHSSSSLAVFATSVYWNKPRSEMGLSAFFNLGAALSN